MKGLIINVFTKIQGRAKLLCALAFCALSTLDTLGQNSFLQTNIKDSTPLKWSHYRCHSPITPNTSSRPINQYIIGDWTNSDVDFFVEYRNQALTDYHFNYYVNVGNRDYPMLFQLKLCKQLTKGNEYHLKFRFKNPSKEMYMLNNLRFDIALSSTVLTNSSVLHDTFHSTFSGKLQNYMMSDSSFDIPVKSEGNELYVALRFSHFNNLFKWGTLRLVDFDFYSLTEDGCTDFPPILLESFDSDTFEIVLSSNLYFEFDSDSINPEVVDYVSKYFGDPQFTYSQITILGYTDTTGTTTYNNDLSYKRALATKKLLESIGVKSDNWKIIGMGESKNVEEAFDKQRNVIIKVVK